MTLPTTIMSEKMTPTYYNYLAPATAVARHFVVLPVYGALAHLGMGTPIVGYDPASKTGHVRHHLRYIQIDTHQWFAWLNDTTRLSFDVHLDGEDDACICSLRRSADGGWYAICPSRPAEQQIPIGHANNLTLRTILEAAAQLFQLRLAEWSPRGRDMRSALVTAYRKQLGLPPVR